MNNIIDTTFSLRPQTSWGAYSCAQALNKSPSTSLRRDIESIEKRITSQILKLTDPLNLLNFAEHPRLGDSGPQDEVLNSYHWTSLSQNLSEKEWKRSKSEQERLQGIYQKLFNQLQKKEIFLQPGQNALIVRALKKLQLDSEKNLNHLLWENAKDHIEEYSYKEIAILANGIHLFTQEERIQLFSAIEQFLCNTPKGQEFIKTCPPHTIVSLLKSHQTVPESLNAKLTTTLISLAQEKLEQFSEKELVDLTIGLGGFQKESTTLKLLQNIEILVSNKLENIKDITFLTCFTEQCAKINFLPIKLLRLIESKLNHSKISAWKKIHLFNSLGHLHYNAVRPLFHQFLQQLNQINSRGKPTWQTLYCKDLFFLLETCVSLFPIEQPYPPHLRQIIEKLKENSQDLSPKMREKLPYLV